MVLDDVTELGIVHQKLKSIIHERLHALVMLSNAKGLTIMISAQVSPAQLADTPTFVGKLWVRQNFAMVTLDVHGTEQARHMIDCVVATNGALVLDAVDKCWLKFVNVQN